MLSVIPSSYLYHSPYKEIPYMTIYCLSLLSGFFRLPESSATLEQNSRFDAVFNQQPLNKSSMKISI